MLKSIYNFYAEILDKNRGKALILVLLQLLVYFSYNAYPYFSQIFIDKIIVLKNYNYVLIFSAIVFLTMLFYLIGNLIFNLLLTKIKLQLAFKLDNTVISRILNAKMKHLNTKPSSFTASRVRNDTKSIVSHFDYFVNTIVANITMAIWVLGYSLSVNVWICVSIIVAFFPIYKFYSYYYKKHKQKIVGLRDIDSEIETFRYELLCGSKVLKMFRSHNYRINNYQKHQEKYVKEGMEVAKIENYPDIVEQLLMDFLPLLLIFVVGGWFLLIDQITIGQWVALNMYSGMFIRPLKQLAKLGGHLVILNKTISRLNEYLNLPQEEEILNNKITKIFNLTLSDIDFVYSDNTVALKKINLVFEKSGVWAVMGTSGSGKSTLASIIAGLFEPTAGICTINGVNRDLIDIDSIRARVSFVTISDFIFSDTVKENIRIASPDVSNDLIINSAKLAKADEFVESLDEKYDTLLGENGLGISEGQKQRIILSRAFLKTDSDVIIFDETTSSLDSTNEKMVLENIINEFKNKIVIFITHHPSVAKISDTIILLKDGSIDATGTHDNLIESNTYYQELYHRGGNKL